LVLLLAAISFSDVAGVRAWAAGNDAAKLTAAMKDARATLQNGIKASECVGTPISAEFEIKDGKLRLSVYTVKGGDFTEGGRGSHDRNSTEGGNGKGEDAPANSHETSVSANRGFRAVSIFPRTTGCAPR
jgi:hypothetical protein